MKLVIVESPNKQTTIKRYLGPEYNVVASQGHIRDLATRGKGGLGIDVDNSFAPVWEIPEKKKAIVAMLKREVAKADEVYLATDPDREGEAIAYHLADVLHLPLDTTKRLRFFEITKPGIEEALADTGTIDMNTVAAQQTRRFEDRIIGFKVSSLIFKKARLRSAGRVQSATLRLIVDRQNEIDSFVPEEYWTIETEIMLEGKKYKVTLSKVDGKTPKITSREQAEAILARIPESLLVSSVAKKEKSISPKLAFSTSTLQQEAYAKLHFSNKKTQDVAQKLFEGLTIGGEHVGLITYLRTDTTRISPEFYRRHAVPYITEAFGQEYIGPLRAVKADANVQGAHEGIRITGTHRTPEIVAQYVSSDEAKLYRLIYCRTMASLMAPKKTEATSVSLTGNGLEFILSGSRTLFKGFTAVYGEFEDEEDAATLPEIKEGSYIAVASKHGDQKFTKPAPHYNAASIVKTMEDLGIGRPSTYASTIVTLKQRKYITEEKGNLIPTEDGRRTVAILNKYFPKVTDTSYTASMEKKLDSVAEGKETFLDAMNEFYGPFMDTFEDAKGKMYSDGPQKAGGTCPICGRDLVIKTNKKGQQFIGCSGFPQCRYIQKEEKPADVPTGEICPKCGHALVWRVNRKGEKFVACSNWPHCDYTSGGEAKPAKKKKTYTKADYVKPCPRCKDGQLVVKEGKKGQFLACTNFPRCRYHESLDGSKPQSK